MQMLSQLTLDLRIIILRNYHIMDLYHFIELVVVEELFYLNFKFINTTTFYGPPFIFWLRTIKNIVCAFLIVQQMTHFLKDAMVFFMPKCDINRSLHVMRQARCNLQNWYIDQTTLVT